MSYWLSLEGALAQATGRQVFQLCRGARLPARFWSAYSGRTVSIAPANSPSTHSSPPGELPVPTPLWMTWCADSLDQSWRATAAAAAPC